MAVSGAPMTVAELLRAREPVTMLNVGGGEFGASPTTYGGASRPQAFGPQQASTTTSTSTTTPAGPRPEIAPHVKPVLPGAPELPTYTRPELAPVDPFVAPEYDETRIAALTQRAAAPGVRTLRMALREITAKRGGEYNPNVRAMTLRKALQGYGTGLESIYGGAAKTAGEEYAREYGIESEEAKINYSQAVNDRDAIFNADLHAADANFQAAINNIKLVYGAKVAAELQSAGEQNARNAAIFEAAMGEYLAIATKTTTSTTTGGKYLDSGGGKYGGQSVGGGNMNRYMQLARILGGSVPFLEYGPLKAEFDVLEKQLTAQGLLK